MANSESPQKEYIEADRTHWEQMVKDYPDIESAESAEAFLDGESDLLPVPREELGSVEGRSLIDLQSLEFIISTVEQFAA